MTTTTNREVVTSNLADFGYREIKMARDLLDAGVTLMMNQNSGNVFLTNEEFEVAMESDGKLYSFYTSPYDGKEGSFEDLLAEYADMHAEDQEWFKELAERLVRVDELPQVEDGQE